MSKSNQNIKTDSETSTDESRRDFLRKSAYAAYTAPIITALLVNKVSAAQSWNNGKGNQNHPGTGNGGINFPQPPG